MVAKEKELNLPNHFNLFLSQRRAPDLRAQVNSCLLNFVFFELSRRRAPDIMIHQFTCCLFLFACLFVLSCQSVFFETRDVHTSVKRIGEQDHIGIGIG